MGCGTAIGESVAVAVGGEDVGEGRESGALVRGALGASTGDADAEVVVDAAFDVAAA